MGYRSNVLICIEENEYKKQQILGFEFPEAFSWSRTDTNTDEGVVYIFIEDTKWYPSYPEVDAVTEFLKKLGDKNYYFLRAGEDTGDVDAHGDLETEAYTSNHIHYPFN
jgi:hypothetical protein